MKPTLTWIPVAVQYNIIEHICRKVD